MHPSRWSRIWYLVTAATMVTTRSKQRMMVQTATAALSVTPTTRKQGTKAKAKPKPKPKPTTRSAVMTTNMTMTTTTATTLGIKESNKALPKKRRKITTTTKHDSSMELRIDNDKSDSTLNSLLLTLPEDIVLGTLIGRPSKRNRSPYVADVVLESEQREVIVHVPNLDMGGKCIPGVHLLLKPARDKKGTLVGPNVVNSKFGTPKCEYIAQLLRVDESALGYESTWVGAHPQLGEQIAEQLIHRNLLGPDFPTVLHYQREVRNIAGTNMRADFVIHHTDPERPHRILEVKTVVDTDYALSRVPTNGVKCVYTNDSIPYKRTAIFPWGQSNQQGPDGERVVSARAIKHVQELTKIARGKHHNGERYDATILFVVIRHDAEAFRPNHQACPSFAKYLKEAKEAGVQILAKQVRWGEGDDIGKCFEGRLLDIVWPE